MNKQLLSLNQDYILEIKFSCNQVKNEKTGYNDPEWTDETKTKANGKKNVDAITVFVPIYDRDGYNTNNFQKAYLDKADIITLAEKIKEIDTTVMIGHPHDELPF